MTYIALPCLAMDLDGLLKPADVRNVSISPDGRHIAVVRGGIEQDTVVLLQSPFSEGNIVAGATSQSGERFTQIQWVSDRHLLIEPTADSQPTGAVFVVTVAGQQKRLLGRNVNATQLPTALVSLLPDSPEHVLLALHEPCAADPCRERALARVNLDTGEQTSVAPVLDYDGFYVSDPSAQHVYAAGRVGDEVHVSRLTETGWQHLSSFDPVTSVGVLPYFVDRSGQTFGVANKRGTADLVSWNPATGIARSLYEQAGSDVTHRLTSYGAEELLAVRTDVGYGQWHYLQPDSKFAQTHKAIRANFPDSDVEVTSFTRDNEQAVLRIYNERTSGDFYLIHLVTGSSQLLAKSRPWLEASTLNATEPVEIVARDGFTLRALLTRTARNDAAPTILWLHDAPTTGRATREYTAEVQLLTNNGYNVLQLNYRGSGGLGQQYAVPAYDTDGQTVQRDIADAARWAVERDIAEAGKVCVFGKGYGAFAALKALAVNSAEFACAVAIEGFYDLSRQYSLNEHKLLTPQLLLQGRPKLDLDDQRRSPVNRAHNITASVLLLGDSPQTDLMHELLLSREADVQWASSGDDKHSYMSILRYLRNALLTDKPAIVPRQSFGVSLTPQQALAFRRIVDEMKKQTRALSAKRMSSNAAVEAQIEKVIEEHDTEVQMLIESDQWQLYQEYKPKLADQLMSELNIVQVM